MKDATALERLAQWPHVSLAQLPTRLLRADRLGHALGAEPLYVKMDAETGFALGGNKVRKLEFALAANQIAGVSCLITAGGPQSNHCRVTAAFAARNGLRCILVTNGDVPDPPTGNARLHRLFGAEIVTVPERADRAPGMVQVAERVSAEGGTPLIVPIGASTGLGSLGYARAAVELAEQLDELDDGCDETILFSSSSSGGTLAGLVLGLAILGRTDVRLLGISADSPARELQTTSLEIAADGARLLETAPDLTAVPFVTLDDQVGEGYGIPTAASIAATSTFGATAGIVLDPTYTSKAAAGMMAWAAEHGLSPHQRLVFLHTGGAPGLLT